MIPPSCKTMFYKQALAGKVLDQGAASQVSKREGVQPCSTELGCHTPLVPLILLPFLQPRLAPVFRNVLHPCLQLLSLYTMLSELSECKLSASVAQYKRVPLQQAQYSGLQGWDCYVSLLLQDKIYNVKF